MALDLQTVLDSWNSRKFDLYSNYTANQLQVSTVYYNSQLKQAMKTKLSVLYELTNPSRYNAIPTLVHVHKEDHSNKEITIVNLISTVS